MAAVEQAEAVSVEVIGTSAALEALNRSEVDMQITTAKKYPRSISRVREKILEISTCDQEVAESCFYAVPRDGKTITGPSVRLAEIVAASYQNLRCGARVIGEEGGSIVCQGVCIDMENNVSASVEVRRRITNKQGRRYSDDMINTTANAGCSIAFRNAVFKTVPSAIFKDIQDKIKKVGMGNERTLVDRRNAAIAFFESKGIKKASIIAMFNRARAEGQPEIRTVEDINLEHIQILNGIKTAVNDGETTYEEAFAMPQETPLAVQALQEKLAAKRGRPAKQAEAAAEAVPTTEAETRAEEQQAAPADDVIPPEACKQYRKLYDLNQRQPRWMQKALENAANKYEGCATLKTFSDIAHAEEIQCQGILDEYEAYAKMVKGA